WTPYPECSRLPASPGYGGAGEVDSIEGQNQRPAAPDVFRLAQRAAASVRPTGTRSGLRIGLCLSGLSGERRWNRAGATRHRMSRNPLNPQVPRLCLVEYRLDYLLG